MKHFSILLFFLLSHLLVFSQSQKFLFSDDPGKYTDELASIMSSGNQSDEDDQLLKKFNELWKGSVLSDDQRKEIIDLSNLMLSKKARGNPHFKSLINSILAIKGNSNIDKSYADWVKGMTQLLETTKTLTAFSNYLNFIVELSNQGYISETSSMQWKFSNMDVNVNIDKSGIKVKFGKGNLTCYSRRDSIIIYDTEGTVNPVDNKWYGKSGRVTWESAGYTADQVNAQLKNYSIELKKSEFDADSVSFTHKLYFGQSILGKLHHEVVPVPKPEDADYPTFDSYSKRYKLNKLYEGVDYDGGFSMRGAKAVGSGSETEDAIIKISIKGNIVMIVKSKFFVFRPDRVNGINTQAMLRLETDSVFHSNVNFVYFVPQKEINLIRASDYSSRSMYSNSYHNIDMDFELFSWKIDQPLINLTMARGSTIGKARFISQNFYNKFQFEGLQGMDEIHPLVALRKYSRVIGANRFNAVGFAHYRNKSINEIRQVLMAMAKDGFIFYNINTDEVLLKKRLFDYLDSSTGKIDFDVMDLNSSTQAPVQNASLNTQNFDLIIKGIPRIFLSDSQNVVIYPNNETIILKRNRSFQFDGRIDAGLFTFYGNNFFFDYINYKVNLQNVDSVQIKVFTGEIDNFGRPLMRNVRNVIQHITGDLLIDKSDNKSGRYNYSEYPLFSSREKSFVYYNSSEIQEGAYPKEKFFFELDPFTLDSLDNFKKEGMIFKGKFESAGILPTLEQELYLQSDYSLGFKINTSKEGMPVYGGKGILFADIQLSNDGLHAKGKLDHLSSSLTSNDLIFYPDSMNTFAETFKMDRKVVGGVEFPQIASTENLVHWLPGKEEMLIQQKKDPFSMYSENATLTGNLKLKPSGLAGSGKMDMKTAELVSREFKYQGNLFDADTSTFNLRSLRKEGFTVLTKNVNAHIDFSTQKGAFTSNEDYSLVEFPENKYISYLDHFNWNMTDKTLEMTAQKTHKGEKSSLASKFPYRFEEEPEGPRYISVNKQQDSLSFVSPVAIYDYEKNIINASEVKLLRVADAIVYTSDGKVQVEEGGIMRTLYKATVVTNYQTKYHTFNMASINIYGRKKYTGEGEYDYIDEAEKTQIIKFTEIKVDSAMQTLAEADVLESNNFTLSPYFDFQGKVKLQSSEKLLYFDGATHIKVDCGRVQPQWLSFESIIDPKKVMIPISADPSNINLNKIISGIMVANDSIHIYPAFLTNKRNYADIAVSTADGYLIFDKDSSTYNIASNEKLADHNSPGNFLSIHRDECTEYGEGVINLGVDLGQLKLTTVGNVKHEIIPNITKLDLMMGIDFMIDPAALNILAHKIDSFPELQGISMNTKTYVRGMNELLGVSASTTYHEELKLFGFVKAYPPQLTHSITLTHTGLTWDDETNSYYYIGKVGIGSVGNIQVNKVVDAYIEIFKKRTGDIMDIYLKLDNKNWFYFGYTRGVMQMLSSHEGFVNLVKNLPNKNRQMDVTSGQTSYIYMVASDAKWTSFRRQYQQRMRKLEMPDDFIPAAPSVSAPVSTPTQTPAKRTEVEKTPASKTQVPKSPGSKTAVDKKPEKKDADKPSEKKTTEDKAPEKEKPVQEEIKQPEVEKQQPPAEEEKQNEEEEIQEIQ